ncbi:MAG: hypothetical protein QM346_12535 [Chloroflexota bacterium]|nr:hypothetical protein [Chloroflexota bacterium]
MARSNDPSKHASVRNEVRQEARNAVRNDGTVDALVLKSVQEIGRYRILEIVIPARLVPQNLFGKFVLARCAGLASGSVRSNWDAYLRRALFVIGATPVPGADEATALRFLVPEAADPGYDWLTRLSPGDSLNFLGPFGRDADLGAHARRLLLVSAIADAPLLIPLADRMLDQGGRVAFIVRGPSADRSLLSLLPLDVELHMAESDEQYHAFLGDAMRWSDALVVCESAMSPRELAGEMQKHRLSSEYDYAQILMRADYVCGAGACMACVVQRSDGSLTRACVHGPVFPLSDLLR